MQAQRWNKEEERWMRERGGEGGAGDEPPLMCLCALCHPASLTHSWKQTLDIEIKCKRRTELHRIHADIHTQTCEISNYPINF